MLSIMLQLQKLLSEALSSFTNPAAIMKDGEDTRNKNNLS
jgi:hypothetical protein